ncbi:MAG: Asp-tRNA(Asn)/Glu-tRNA(Gln) amidotransferase subunit GatC [Anaerolineae bacterium]
MAKLSLAEVEHIAELARLALSDEEKELFRDQLSAILDYAEMLQRLDTDDVPPTASALPLDNVMRPDEQRPALPVEDALANAPDRQDDYFRVKAVLDGE